MSFKKFVLAAAFAFVGSSASAALINVDSGHALGIAAPTIVDDDTPATSTGAIQFFNEVSDLLLTDDLLTTTGLIKAGTRVDSHLVFLNVDAQLGRAVTQATLSFSTEILGLITDRAGVNNSHGLLGGLGTAYGSLYGLNWNDAATFLGGQLNVQMTAQEARGDWIRVVTVAAPMIQTAPVPVPASGLLIPLGLAGLAALRRRRRTA